MLSCRDQAVSEEYYDYIYNQNWIPSDMSERSCEIDAGYGMSVCFRPKEDGFAYENYYTLPKLFGLSDVNAAEAAGALKIQRPDSLGLTGSGCLIGLIDTGIQYDHEVFLDEMGHSRVVGIWDQTADAEEITGNSSNVQTLQNTRFTPYGTADTQDGIQSDPYGIADTQDGIRSDPYSIADTQDGIRSDPYGIADTQDGIRSDPYGIADTQDGIRSDPYSIADTQDRIRSVPYGVAYTHAEILAGTAKGQDENGHGTFLASLAAGRSIPSEGFTGIAPEAGIAMVKLKPAKRYLRELFLLNNDAVAFEESDILLGVRYLLELAAELEMPLVILLGLESSSGSHTGSLALDDYLSQAAARSGVAIVCAAGNEGDKKHHYYGSFSSRDEFLDVELNVGNLAPISSADSVAARRTSSANNSPAQETTFADNAAAQETTLADSGAAPETTFSDSAATHGASSETGFTLELWGAPPDIYSLSVISPGGEMVPRITASITQNGSYEFLLSPSVVEVGFRLLEFSGGDQLIFLRFRNPSPGVWRIRVYNRNLLYGSFHMWLPIEAFLAGDVSFLSPSPDTTVTAPGNSTAILTFSGYDSRTGSFYPASGRGFTAKGLISPELAAPAADILGARLIPVKNKLAQPQNNAYSATALFQISDAEETMVHTTDISFSDTSQSSSAPQIISSEIARFERRSGTSCAAAIGAGACALLLEWGIRQNHLPGMRTAVIRNILIRGAGRSRNVNYPSREFGYGTLNVEDAFLVLADLL